MPVAANPSHILIVDDDRRLRKLLRQYLSGEGFAVSEAADAAQARELLTLLVFDLIILDVMMPGESGLSLANHGTTQTDWPPIILLTAMDSADDRVAGLETGVEDYLTKPFEPRELLLRIGNILKRRAQFKKADAILRFGPYTFDLDTRRLTGDDGAEIHLTTAEAALLSVLAQQKGQPISREELARQAGLEPDASGRAVDMQITRLRKKIESDTARPRYLQTVRGAGYRLVGDS